MTKAIIYTRVSTDEQADKGYSLRDQEARLRQFCELQHIEVIAHYQDDHSAKTFDRPEFKKLEAFVKANKQQIDKLLVVKWDRFSRNATDALMMLRTFDKMGIEINAVEQPIDLSIPEQKMMLNFYLTAPEVENDRRALNTTNGMRRAMKEGRWVSNAPMGYKMARDERNKPILVCNEKASLVKEAFELYSKGIYDIEEVRKKMVAKGMKCERNNFWKMLRNPVYCGKILIKAWKKEPEEIVQGIHEPIISEGTFYRVQDVLRNKKRNKAKAAKKVEALPLRGYLVCKCCEKNLTGSASKGNGGKYFYYHGQAGCKERENADIVHKSFSEWLGGISIKPEIKTLYMAIMEDIYKTQEGDREIEIKRLKSEIDKRKELVVKVERKFIEDDLDKDSYKRMKSSYQREQFQLTDMMNELSNTDTAFLQYLCFGMNVLSNLRNVFDSSSLEGKQKLVGLIFPEKLIYDNGNYRTKSESAVYQLLLNADKVLGENKKGQDTKNRELSFMVARRGIEPLFPP